MSEQNASVKRPYIGFLPFDYADRDYFFGRDRAVAAVESLVLNNGFVAIVGSSGAGKSSLVRAGLIPKLEARPNENWRFGTMAPGDAPIRRLAETISSLRSKPDDLREAWDERIELLLRRSKFGIPEALSMFSPLDRKARFLLIVDQFEEIFRFASLRTGTSESRAIAELNRDEATSFVRLILEANAQDAVPVNVVITMRSDFIGDCARFHDLPEAVSQHQYLVPGLTRDELADGIVRPAVKAGGRIDPELVQRLLNDTNEDPDQLPILQHVLMRCWQSAVRRRAPDAPVKIELADYSAAVGEETALSNHGNEILAALKYLDEADPSPLSRNLIAKRIFQALTEVDRTGRVIRRPIKFGDLSDCVRSSDWSESDTKLAVRSVVERFADADCGFLRIIGEGDLCDSSIIDIGHEALIRRWSKLKGEGGADWIREEQDDGERYWELAKRARAASVISGSELDDYVKWWGKVKPTAAWARRYTKDGKDHLNSIIDLLERSRKARDEEKETKRLAAEAQNAQLEAKAAKALAYAAKANVETEKARAAVAVQEAKAAKLEGQKARLHRLLALAGCLILAAALGFYYLVQQRDKQAEARDRLDKEIRDAREHRQNLLLVAAKGVIEGPKLVGAGDALALLQAYPDPDWGNDIFRNAIYKTMELVREVRRLAPEQKPAYSPVMTSVPASPVGLVAKPVVSVSMNPKVPVVAALKSGRLYFLRYEDGGQKVEQLADLPAGAPDFGSVRWSPDGTRIYIASVNENGWIIRPCGNDQLRNALPGCVGKTGDEKMVVGEGDSFSGVGVWSGNGEKIVTGGFFGKPHVWDAGTGKLVEKIESLIPRPERGVSITTLAVSVSGEYLAEGDSDGNITIDEISRGEKRGAPQKGPNGIRQLIFNPANEDQILAVTQSETNVWSIKHAGQPQKLDEHGASVMQAAFDPNGRFIVTASNDGSVRVFDIASDQLNKGVELRGHRGPAFAVDVDKDGTIVSGGTDGTIRFWRRWAAREANETQSKGPLAIAELRKTMESILPYDGYGQGRISVPPEILCSLQNNCPKDKHTPQESQ
ncbi:hypothetical protein [uncultured Rhodoblastus sp.]|uniref:nSTAND1 domain-containing NTPase n=1 Tax=uncultured Rhodoblastus sp. TaxID=543037 RepID=UPI0025F6FA16|nr:hypothetical protein [uncultured Rhodoblastus sp.]